MAKNIMTSDGYMNANFIGPSSQPGRTNNDIYKGKPVTKITPVAPTKLKPLKPIKKAPANSEPLNKDIVKPIKGGAFV